MSIYVPPRVLSLPPVKAGPVGPGAGILQTELPLSILGVLSQRTPGERMRKAIQLASEAAWPEAAEDVIGMTIVGQPWTLEDADETKVDDAYPDESARKLLVLLEKPQSAILIGRKYTRSELWRMTFRHMGLCGNAFWYLDQRDALAGTPGAILYIHPWRMTPNEDAKGNLLSWQIDRTPQSPGLTIELDEVVHFMLRPPDHGHYGRGLIESALLKAQNSVSLDRHITQVLSAGGRLAGLIAPRGDSPLNDQQYNQLVADARTIVEQPDAAKRLQILRGPIDFTPTAMTIADLQVVELLKLMRDDLLALWGVPLSQIGGATPAGLNSGETRKYDKQALWENANHPRIVPFTESIQNGIVDRWAGLGVVVDFEIEEPEFDDDSARFDLLGKSLNTPLRNRERRALVGLEPFGETIVNPETQVPYDDEVWLPISIGASFNASEVRALAPAPIESPPTTPSTDDGVALVAGGRPMAKASLRPNVRGLHASLVSLRQNVDARMTPRVKQSVASFLTDQRREIASRVKGMAEHLMAKPGDAKSWWDGPKWDRQLNAALRPTLVTMAEEVDAHIRPILGKPHPAGKAGPVGAVNHVLTKGATRITAINARTRDAVIGVIRTTVAAGIADGKSPADVGDDLEAAINSASLDNGTLAFDEYRAEMVARTEMMAACNDAALGSYADADVTEVQAIDGDDDPECSERDGQTFSLDEADAIEDHPNGTLDWVPVIGEP